MPDSCPVCGSTSFRESLSGTVCAECGAQINTDTSASIGASVRESTDYLDSDSDVTAGDFTVSADDFRKAEDAHESRPAANQRRDENRRARITTDRGKWESDKDSYDFPGVDTPTERPTAIDTDLPFADEGVLDDLL